MKIKNLFLVLTFVFLPTLTSAQELHQDLQGIWRAEVVEIESARREAVPGTGLIVPIQTIRAKILEGERSGEVVTLKNDYLQLKVGQKFFMNYLITVEGYELFEVRDVDRRSALGLLALIFAGAVLVFSGKQGLRSLLSLGLSLSTVIFVLLPLLVKGYPPVLSSVLVGSAILFFAIFFTHGWNRESAVALLGTTTAVVLTGLISYLAIKLAVLSGFFSDETVYLNLGTAGTLNFEGLLLGGIIIGVLGVLDDIAITQSAIVAELKSASSDLSAKEIYKRAMRVGREHVSALVNTLVLAYTGVSLPLLLWFSRSESSFSYIVNNEIFATEIVRTIVGSIGLILTVPITTLLAVWLTKPNQTRKGHSHHPTSHHH